MRSPFKEFLKDTIMLYKKDGKIFEDIKAQVGSNKVFTENVDIPFEDGDYICRTLPNGIKENFLIVQANYTREFHGIPASYHLETRKMTRQEYDNFKTINNYITGDNNRVNVNSIDNSNNVYNDSKILFNELRNVVEIELNNNAEIIDKINQLESNIGNKKFITKYNDFIQSMANHISIIVPFIPALTNLLSQIKF